MGRSTLIGFAATVCLMVGASSANAGSPLRACWKSQLEAAAQYAVAVGVCLDKEARKGKDFRRCDSKKAQKLSKHWTRAIEDAARKGADCSQGSAAAEVSGRLGDTLEDLRDDVTAGIPPGANARDKAKLLGRILKASGAYAGTLSEAEGRHAKKPDDSRLDDARQDAKSKYEKRWNKAVRKADESGLVLSVVFSDNESELGLTIGVLVGDVVVGEEEESACRDFPPPAGRRWTFGLEGMEFGFSLAVKHVNMLIGGREVYNSKRDDTPAGLGHYVGCDEKLGLLDVATDSWNLETGEFTGRAFWEPPLHYAQYGDPVGTVVEWTGLFDGERERHVSEVLGYEDVTVPGGTFLQAMKMRNTSFDEDNDVFLDSFDWIDEEVLLVQSEDPDSPGRLVLEKYRPTGR